MRKAIVAVVLVMALAVGGSAVLSASHQLEDVDEDHWAYEAVEQLVAAGIVEGYPDGEYKGGQTMTRYEMAMIIQRTLDNINADIDALEADVADMEDGLTAAQAADVTEIVQEMIAEEMPAASDELTEQQAEDVTAIVQALVSEFEQELEEMEAELGALEYTMETETDALRAETEGINETLENMEARIAELEAEHKQYEGSLTMELDTINQRLSPETVSVDTDFTLTFDHTHYIRDGFTAYVEWTPDDSSSASFAEGDVLELTLEEELHGVPGLQMRAFHDSLDSYGGQVLDLHRDAHLQATFDAAEELDIVLGADVDTIFDNNRDNLHDEQYGKLAHLGLYGSLEMLDFGVDIVDGRSMEGYVPERYDIELEFYGVDLEYDFTAYEVNLEVADLVENLDLTAAYYYYDDELIVVGGEDHDEDYDGFEIGVVYDIADTRYWVGLDYANVEAGYWEFSDGTPTDHPAGVLHAAYGDGDGAELVALTLGADDIIGFDHEFSLEYWDADIDEFPYYTDLANNPFYYDYEDYKFEWFMTRDIGENTLLEITTTYTDFDEDVLNEDGCLAVETLDDSGGNFSGEEDSRLDVELYLEHQLLSW